MLTCEAKYQISFVPITCKMHKQYFVDLSLSFDKIFHAHINLVMETEFVTLVFSDQKLYSSEVSRKFKFTVKIWK